MQSLDELAPDPLAMPPAEMRRLGYRVVEHAENGDAGPAEPIGDPQELRAALGGPVPREPGDPRGTQMLVDDRTQESGSEAVLAAAPG